MVDDRKRCIHSLGVPEFGLKKDAYSRFYFNEALDTMWTRPGTLPRPGCTELCGKGHGFMPIVVEAVGPGGRGGLFDTRPGL